MAAAARLDVELEVEVVIEEVEPVMVEEEADVVVDEETSVVIVGVEKVELDGGATTREEKVIRGGLEYGVAMEAKVINEGLEYGVATEVKVSSPSQVPNPTWQPTPQ